MVSLPITEAAPKPHDRNERILADAKALYDSEEARRKEFDDRAKSLLTLSAAYTAFVALVFKDAKPQTALSRELVMCAVAALAICLASAAICSAVRTFIEPYTPNDLVDASDAEEFDMDEYVLNRTAAYVSAVELNTRVGGEKGFCVGSCVRRSSHRNNPARRECAQHDLEGLNAR